MKWSLLFVFLFALLAFLFAPRFAVAQQCGPPVVDQFNAQFNSGLQQSFNTQSQGSGGGQFQQVGLFGRRRGGGGCGSGGCGNSSVSVDRTFTQSATAPVTPQNEMSYSFRQRYGASGGMESGCNGQCSQGGCEQQQSSADLQIIESLKAMSATVQALGESVEKLEAKKTQAKSTGWFAQAPAYTREQSMSMTWTGNGYAPSGFYGARGAAFRGAARGAGWGYPPREFKTPVRSFIQGGRAAAQQDRVETDFYNRALGY